MIKSMTAFARSEKNNENQNILIEARSLNSKYLDIFIRMSSTYQSLEEQIRKKISQKISRGRIELSIHIDDRQADLDSFEINWEKAKAYYNCLNDIKEYFHLDSEIPLTTLLGGQIIKPVENVKDFESIWGLMDICIDDILDNLNEMKVNEGKAISHDFEKRLDYIEKQIDIVENSSDEHLKIYHEKLKERMDSLTKGSVETDPVRIAQEAALFADRSDISEEILRIRSNVTQFRNFLDVQEPVGRKLNFILQEIGREFNTIGSKTASIEASKIIVDLKSEHEKLREQIQNIE